MRFSGTVEWRGHGCRPGCLFVVCLFFVSTLGKVHALWPNGSGNILPYGVFCSVLTGLMMRLNV